ncbi:MAG TPA: zinc metalloprotease, partial [Pyrinomonadaceae bacterium]|nr:zinc metalloprotease [Pyrinomonadaceae bacterium]
GETVFSSVQEFAESLPARCPTVGPTPEERQRIEMKREELERTNPERRKTGTITIPVFFHIITNAEGTEGNVSDAAVQLQMDVLNAAFAGSPFRFVLAGPPDRTANDVWFNMEYREIPADAEREAKAKLNRGDKSTLNVYTVRLATQAFGWARYPWQLADKVDGIVVRYSTLPGGISTYYNEGDTAVHETGHWLGLYHTFEYGCDPGDEVDDTPPEASAATYCPVARNSCPATGFDPVENYMDFTWDSCMFQFTPGQVVRMDDMHRQYRM